MGDLKKIISVRVEPEIHKELKILAVNEDTTLQDYIVNLIKKDLKKKSGRKW